MISESTLIILIAPNVSEQMGGEGIKALQIFRELRKAHGHVIQITHARNRTEILEKLKLDNVEFVEDTPIVLFLWKSVVLRIFLNPLFSKQAISLAESIARAHHKPGAIAVLHQTEPNSPVAWRVTSRRYSNVFGPINGNIYYPALFRSRESTAAKLRRIFHMPLQRLNRFLPGGIKRADLIFCAGGERTTKSLLAAGCDSGKLQASVDCGVPDYLLDRPRIEHRGPNRRFVHFGRLVFHKCTFLIIESLVKTKEDICLDIVGRGPELDNCRRLVGSLGLEARVRFLDWYPKHSDLLDSLAQYRGVVLPSIEDANGIVVQESMALGLPAVCLDWGGPQLLIEDKVSGFLIAPTSVSEITRQMAACLDALGADGALAEAMSVAARNRANDWRWSVIAQDWLKCYPCSSQGQ